ncbi:hypothetical protein AAHA92_15183 [Salvia divinorum]|uniref:Uncharacterized protein n=1 Tax=Salvia divinorum TaxID=28513 RepID=A0ABD1HDX5_SALDI
MPPPVMSEAESGYSARRSIETLVVVLAAITIISVVARIIARLCGGHHSDGEHDVEGWMESKCRSCIDGGIPAAAKLEGEPKPPGNEEAKK